MLLLAASLPGAAIAQETLELGFESPSSLAAVFGEVEVRVRAYGEVEIVSMELRVNGRQRATRSEPPWVFQVDVGQENREHRFEVRARGAGGEEGFTELETPALKIDDEVSVELQQLYVTATDRQGRRVLDLGQGEIRVLDNGREQSLVTFARGDIPLTATILIDSSESMRGERLRAALHGARVFVEGMKELDEAMVMLFSDQLSKATHFTADSGELLASLEGAVASGNTSINDHLYLALKLLEPRQGRRVVVLFTDGADLHSVLDMEQVLWKARRSQALIYWIRLADGRDRHHSFATAWRDAEGNRRELEFLKQSVSQSGGRIAVLEDLGQIEGAFRDILAELREQYVLGYYPSEVKNDGSWHEVKVDVRRPGIRLRTRDGYVD
ncbi:MAG: VWA domain-containing protein [Holophagales bacterium]|nr:VWA domain-containing protein [Holophagales bacterium]